MPLGTKDRRRLTNRSEYATIIDMKKLLTLEQAAVDLPVTAVTLRKYCLRGQIGLKLGDRWFLTPADIAKVRETPKAARKAGRRRKSER